MSTTSWTRDLGANTLHLAAQGPISASDWGADQLQAIRLQEISSYRTFDYLQPTLQQLHASANATGPLICLQWREAICEWAYRCKLSKLESEGRGVRTVVVPDELRLCSQG